MARAVSPFARGDSLALVISSKSVERPAPGKPIRAACSMSAEASGKTRIVARWFATSGRRGGSQDSPHHSVVIVNAWNIHSSPANVTPASPSSASWMRVAHQRLPSAADRHAFRIMTAAVGTLIQLAAWPESENWRGYTLEEVLSGRSVDDT